MRKKSQKLTRFYLLGVLLIILLLTGCGDDKDGSGSPYLIRVRDRVFSVMDFNRNFETIKTAYDEDTFKDKMILNNARIRLLDQKIEELILLERAEDMNIDISEETLEKEIFRIKDGFPEGGFEQVFLENAVSFKQWKNGLKNRLIMEEVITAELRDRIEISQADIEKYYLKINNENGMDLHSRMNDKNSDENTIAFLRRQKKEDVYQEWIKNLRDRYQVEINEMEWNRICSSRPG